MDRYLSPSRTAPSTQLSLLPFAPRFTRTNHASAKRQAPVLAKRGPGRPRKRPRPVDMDDRFVHTWYASMEKEIQEAVNVAESYSDGYIVFFSSKPSSSNKVSSFAYGRKTIRSSQVRLVCYASVRCI